MAAPRQLTRTLPAVPASVPRARRAIADLAEEVGAPEHVLEHVRLAVSEAVSNVVLHAYVEAPGPGVLRVDARAGPAGLAVTVTDYGRGMVPRLDSPGLGLGLALIAHASDAFEVHEVEGGGTAVRMRFVLAP